MRANILDIIYLIIPLLFSYGYIFWSYRAWKDTGGCHFCWCKINIGYSSNTWILGTHYIRSISLEVKCLPVGLSIINHFLFSFFLEIVGSTRSLCCCLQDKWVSIIFHRNKWLPGINGQFYFIILFSFLKLKFFIHSITIFSLVLIILS